MNVLNRIRKILKSLFDLISNEKVKLNILNAVPFWMGAFISGLIAVVYAQLFSWAEEGAHLLFHASKYGLMIVTPLCFIFAYWLVAQYAPYARGSGIPQVTAAIELSNPKHKYKVSPLLSLRVVLVKIFSSLSMALGGGVIGREGPTIQVAASIFKKINDWLPPWYPKISKRNMIVTGAASGLAAAFNTPLGGIVFAIEELTKTHISYFKSALLTGVIIAGLTALQLLGPYLYLGYPKLDFLNNWMIISVMPLALITGLAGASMGKLIIRIIKKKKQFPKKIFHYFYAAIAGLLIASIAICVDSSILGSGKEIMVDSLFSNSKHLEWHVPVLRFFGQIISFPIGAAGGVFAPSLSAGASIGSFLANLFHLSHADTNLMILCGMTGFLTGITRSPFTSSILVLEMTNSHNVIFYIMLTALFSNLVANLISRHSFYDQLKEDIIQEVQSDPTLKLDTELAK